MGDEVVLDPWIALTAIALHTSRVKIGLLATPLARHRPWLVAQRLANLDHLSAGRMICTVGLGYSERDFAAFSEASSSIVRAQKLDEALTVLAGLWTEDQFTFAGDHYTVQEVMLRPKPVQSPRIPIWVAGSWPRRAPFRRAVRWDGVCLMSINAETKQWLTLDDFRACVSYVQAQRGDQSSFDVIMSGDTSGDRQEAIAKVQAFGEAGATWWVEEGLGWSLEEFTDHIHNGPPRG